jgi:hypothetical protein
MMKREFSKLIYDYARGKKKTQRVRCEGYELGFKEYKKGYKEFIVREVKGIPFATLVAGKCEDGKFYIGVSCCNTVPQEVKIGVEEDGSPIMGLIHDVFSKQIGKTEAKEQLFWSETAICDYLVLMPAKVIPAYTAFVERCTKYYQGATPAFDYLAMVNIQKVIQLEANEAKTVEINACEGQSVCGSACACNGGK